MGLFLTFSRAAWLACVLGVIVYVVHARAWKERLVQRLGGLLLLLCLVLVVAFFPIVRSRITGVGRLELMSTTERVVGLRESLALIQSHVFVGVGMGNYTGALHDTIRPSNPPWSYQPVHNMFFLIFAELGIVGFMLFFVFLMRLHTHRPSLLVSLLTLFFFDHSFWALHSGIVLLWFTLSYVDIRGIIFLNQEKGSFLKEFRSS